MRGELAIRLPFARFWTVIQRHEQEKHRNAQRQQRIAAHEFGQDGKTWKPAAQEGAGE